MRNLLIAALLFSFQFVPFSVTFAQDSIATFEKLCETGDSQEECAIEKLNHGLLPPEQASESADVEVSSWLTSIGQTLGNIVAFFTGANNLQNSYVASTEQQSPTSTSTEPAKEEEKEGIIQAIIKTLAGSEGYYGSTLPQEEELPTEFKKPEGDGLQIGPTKIELFKAINAEEKYFCNGYIPQEICKSEGNCERIECPITGQPNQ
jgi:hypothetical protein